MINNISAHQRHGGIARSIFREYDIRGISGESLFTEDAYSIGRAFSSRIFDQNRRVCVCRDGRLSSPSLSEALIQGILDSGVDVIDIGVGPTPMLYFAAYMLNASGAIMVTGSHNPPKHNGMKFVLDGKPFYGADIQSLYKIITDGLPSISTKGSVQLYDIKHDYIKKLLSVFHEKKSIGVAWDAGNGAAGEIMEALCKSLPGNHIALNATIDGRFPVHHPDPSVAENLYQLVDEVKKKKLDIGVAFDGDGDRVGIIDDEGFIIWPDQLMMLFAREVLQKCPGAMIIADVKTSDNLFSFVKSQGGVPLMWKTGHSHIKAKMAETGAKLAGEMSGHIFFADEYYGFDDGLYAAMRAINIVSNMDIKLSEWRKQMPKLISTPEIRFPCDDGRKFTVITEVAARLTSEGIVFNNIDGVRVNSDGGWWLLRASNTQPMLVARCEADTQDSLDKLVNVLQKQLTASGIRLPS
ncbi:MAG: phosphoglucomutase/phosphomannomutase PgmG [Alphaproteobacteria bacterium]